MLKLVVAIGASSVALSGVAHAITITDGRSSAQSILTTDRDSRFNGVGLVGTGCTGTAIASNLVLTAAHCFASDQRRSSFLIPFSDVNDSVSQSGDLFIFPGYDRAKQSFDQLSFPDLAVIKLDNPLPNYVRTYGINSAFPGAISGHVGYGRTGTGVSGQLPGTDGTKRFGFNEVERIEENGNYFVTDFDGSGANTLGDNGLGLLEVATAPGDSGGPVFFNPARNLSFNIAKNPPPPGTTFKLTPDVDYIMGVTSYGTWARGQDQAGYGSLSYFTNVGPFAYWAQKFSGDVYTASAPRNFEKLGVTTKVDQPNYSSGPAPELVPDVAPVPLPAGLLLLLSALAATGVAARLRKA